MVNGLKLCRCLNIKDNIFRDCEKYIIGEHCKNVTIDSNTFLPKGDVNADSNFDIADAVTLQKWLVQSPDAELSDWLSADICKDNAIDSVDLVMMRKMIVISK